MIIPSLCYGKNLCSFLGFLRPNYSKYPAFIIIKLAQTDIRNNSNKYGAGDGNRTHVTSLEGWGSTIELHPRDSYANETK